MNGYVDLLVCGGWPALIGQPVEDAYDYLTAYLADLALVDLPQMDVRTDPQRMTALLRAVARNVSTEVRTAKLVRESEIQPGADDGTGLSQITARRCLDALARVFVLEEQPAWSTHLRSKVRLRTHAK